MKPLALSLGALALATSVSSAIAQQQPTWVTSKPLELKIHMHFRDKYVWDENWPTAKEVFRLTNVKLVNTASKTATNSREQFNLLMASGKLPDIIGGDGLKDDFIKYGLEGAFVNMRPLIDRHAPNLKAFLAANPIIDRGITAPDGGIYYIPYVGDGTVSRGWWIRQDWLNKLGLKVPNDYKELESVLTAFRDRDPNGNGKKDEIPYFNSSPNEVFRLVLLWGARSSGGNASMLFMEKNGKVVHPFADAPFRPAIANVARWYKDGLIDKEIFTRRSRAREQLWGNNNGGVTHDWFASTSTFNEANSTARKATPDFKVIPIAPPADVNGNRFEEDSRNLFYPDGWAITLANKNPVETIKLFDFYFTRAGRNLSNFGVEGQQYDMVAGKPVYRDSILKAGKPVNSLMWDIGAQIPIGFWQDYEYERQWTFPTGLEGRDMYIKGKYNIPQFIMPNMTREERAIYDLYWPDLQTYMSEQAQNWVLGTKDVNKDWDGYIRYLRSSGYYEVIQVLQKAWDRQYKTRAPAARPAAAAAPAPAAKK